MWGSRSVSLLACVTCVSQCVLLGVLGLVDNAVWLGGVKALRCGPRVVHACPSSLVGPSGCWASSSLLWYLWEWFCVACWQLLC